MSPKVTAIVVSHNSEKTLERCIQGLTTQDYPLESIILVDSGSTDIKFISHLQEKYSFELILSENIGFSKANNLGYAKVQSGIDFVIFVNPDLFLPQSFVTDALKICNDTAIGMLSGKLLSYDQEQDRPSGRIDSTGIKRRWFGRWYDRGQGEHDHGQYKTSESMPALCGALLFCRKKALNSFDGVVFDPDFFLYKEDIELSIRMRKLGEKLLYHPALSAYHCRGWQNERSKMPYELRLLAAKSELLLYKKHPSPYVLWAVFKYLLVKFFRL
jgi:GT2 family glycosyltransferase